MWSRWATVNTASRRLNGVRLQARYNKYLREYASVIRVVAYRTLHGVDKASWPTNHLNPSTPCLATRQHRGESSQDSNSAKSLKGAL